VLTYRRRHLSSALAVDGGREVSRPDGGGTVAGPQRLWSVAALGCGYAWWAGAGWRLSGRATIEPDSIPPMAFTRPPGVFGAQVRALGGAAATR
jgi:hypothetical protein